MQKYGKGVAFTLLKTLFTLLKTRLTLLITGPKIFVN